MRSLGFTDNRTRLTVRSVRSQKEALYQLASLAERSILNPLTNETAKIITRNVRARDDVGELQAIYDAVKNGHPDVPGMEQGFRYVSDPRMADLFISAHRSLEACARGACAGDCDDHDGLIVALGGTLGFRMGMRAWGPIREREDEEPEFVHVYAVAALPKHARGGSLRAFGMDTTVPEASFGWEPPHGHIMTAWLE